MRLLFLITDEFDFVRSLFNNTCRLTPKHQEHFCSSYWHEHILNIIAIKHCDVRDFHLKPVASKDILNFQSFTTESQRHFCVQKPLHLGYFKFLKHLTPNILSFRQPLGC